MRSGEYAETPRGEARKSMTKADEFVASAGADAAASRWNAAGLSAVHAGICAADAALISSAGLRSTSSDHGAVIGLLDAQVPEFGAAQRRQLSGLMKMKNKVAYEQRLLTETEARQLVDHAARLSAWARGVVVSHIGEAG